MRSETERSGTGHVDEHPYSVAFRSGDLVAVSGRLGVDASGRLVPGGFDTECARAFANLDAALGSAGASRNDVVMVVAYLTDIADRSRLNAVYQDFFTEPRPARSCVGVAALPYGAVVEIEALARVREAPGIGGNTADGH
ncbi:reactive intermediate/imine deaminase [Actinomadura sp. KC216]|uniref:Rid family hydrolase n=1 Tax=Actinomadura sp. KC216 TaxID=2530370 RepID=UPI0010464D02|nr:Rid family hydrolase [Actinomadura sp. KC216]TDB88446.1 reactive intermediate/imine deaminase [Actinomadura sp. KC216]